jgi:short-subunit dehydrogenase
VNCVIVGASAGLGRALAETFAAAGYDLVLVASDRRDLDANASDLRIRYRLNVVSVEADVARDDGWGERLSAAVAGVGGADVLLLPIGAVDDADDGSLPAQGVHRLVGVNFVSVVQTVTMLLPVMRGRERAAIVGFGSVAATRGRSANVVYAASKRALESYFESLRHACQGTHVTVRFFVLGYLDTALAYGRRLPFPVASPGHLAARVRDGLWRDAPASYFPRWWRPICAMLRWLPWPVFRRMRA